MNASWPLTILYSQPSKVQSSEHTTVMASDLYLPHGAERQKYLMQISDERREVIKNGLIDLFNVGPAGDIETANEKATLCIQNLHRLRELVMEGAFTSDETSRVSIPSMYHAHQP